MTRGYEPERGHGRYNSRDDHDVRSARGRERGVPDSLLIGLLIFLLGLTLLVWTATGLAGLLAHGSWPHGVSYPGTPIALRHLVAAPHDLAAAWPHTPKSQLSGYGLFWGILIGELMVLLVLTIFTLGTVTRYRAVRAARRQATRASARDTAAAEPHPEAATTAPPPHDTASAPAPPPPPASLQKPPAAAGTTTPPADDLHPDQRPTPPPNSPIGSKPLESPEQVNPTTAATTAPTPATAALSQPPLPHLHFSSDRTATRATAAAAITSAEGPLIVATTDADLWAETKDARAKLGPLLTYDPTHRLDTPARLRWSPTSGCEDITTATTRAAALLAPVRPNSTLDSAVADAAQTLLRCWLHAAAVDGRPFRQLHRWAHATGAAQEPVRILRTNPKASTGQAGELESVLTAHAERREMAKELIGRSLAALSSIHIRDACNPPRADSLILESFVDEGGTLYVVGEPIEDPRTTPGAMPLITALLSHVVEHGRRMAERSSDGRLDPPLTLVLDDIAALAPLPTLPDLLDTGHTRGLLTLATMRSQEQARARWPHRALPV
ncbi:type IV secretory system conjugative DNA transfer family protein [Streptomyces sp. NPDC101150]|uniref:type IV secretory system conjugative DNA transfer family protein n=1 Tax=Streptomyces sp. NPDC101150 TaxID=3366114 RepID=UPI0038228851